MAPFAMSICMGRRTLRHRHIGSCHGIVALPQAPRERGRTLLARPPPRCVTRPRTYLQLVPPGEPSAVRPDGTVTVPKHYHELMRAWIESGWQGLAAPEAHGGQGLPHTVWTALVELASAADMAFFLGPILTAGAIDCLHRFPPRHPKARLPNAPRASSCRRWRAMTTVPVAAVRNSSPAAGKPEPRRWAPPRKS